MKYKITNKTGMRLRYAEIKFEPKESKILELENTHEHEYFTIKKLDSKKSLKSLKRPNKLTEVKQDGISRRME